MKKDVSLHYQKTNKMKSINQTNNEIQIDSNFCIYFNGEYLTYSEVAIKLLELEKIKNIINK